MRALVFTPLLLAVALLPMLAGCDTTEATVEDAAAAPSPMFAAAPLSDTTASVVRTALERYADGGRRPGALWTAAADLAGTLTGAQQAELIAAAPDGWRGPRWTGRRALPRRALTGLGLSDAQRAALRSIREAYRPELRALRLTARSGDGPFDAHRERFEALRAAFRADVDAVLTDEQRAALDAKRAARQERRGRHAPGAFRAEARAAMIAALDLTAAQADALEAHRTAQRAAIRLTLSELRTAGSDREEIGTALQRLRAQHEAELTEILTPDQVEITRLHRALVRLRRPPDR